MDFSPTRWIADDWIADDWLVDGRLAMSENCDEALVELYPFLDGELDQTTVGRIREHLEDCPPCEERFDFETRLKAVVRKHLREEVPPEVIYRLRAVIRSESGLAAE